MGGTATPAALVAARHPATRLVVTPADEADVTCRLALAAHLSAVLPAIPPQLLHLILTGEESSEGEPEGETAWRPVHNALSQLAAVDPACGEGDVLLSMGRILEQVGGFVARSAGIVECEGQRRERIYRQNLYGVEAQAEPLRAARRRLTDNAGTIDPHLRRGDSIVEGEFCWRAAFPEIMDRGGFDLVIGNPPYVRHERIVDPLGRLPAELYKRAIGAAVERRLPAIFGRDEGKGRAAQPLDRRSDLAMLFLCHGVSLLRPAGALGFVLPSGMLEARYGSELYRVLAGTRRTALALESGSRRSFPGVNVTICLVAPSIPGDAGPSRLRRVSLAGPLERGALRAIWPARQGRVGPIRPPAAAPHTVPLGTLARLRYPIKTGLNAFFYPHAETVARFGIEPACCRSLLKSPREVDRISIGPETLRSRVFVCDLSLDELRAAGMWGALGYIEWGSRQRTRAGIPWPAVTSLKGRRRWYSLPLPPPAQMVTPRFIDRRFLFAVPPETVIEDQTFYGLLLPEQEEQRDLLAALLNCSLTYLSLECHGRTGLGDGVRQYALCDLASLPVLDPRAVPSHLAGDLIAAYRRLAARPIEPIDREVLRADRHALDGVIGEATGQGAAGMAAVRVEVAERVRQRLARAQSTHGAPALYPSPATAVITPIDSPR